MNSGQHTLIDPWGSIEDPGLSALSGCGPFFTTQGLAASNAAAMPSCHRAPCLYGLANLETAGEGHAEKWIGVSSNRREVRVSGLTVPRLPRLHTRIMDGTIWEWKTARPMLLTLCWNGTTRSVASFAFVTCSGGDRPPVLKFLPPDTGNTCCSCFRLNTSSPGCNVPCGYWRRRPARVFRPRDRKHPRPQCHQVHASWSMARKARTWS